MPPDRAERVAEIVEQALEHEPAERRTFVDESCNGDTGLRREVNELLGHAAGARDFIETPVFKIDPEQWAEEVELRIGATMGDYQIIGLIGEGGMGEVYLAEDRKLRRQVALKLVRPSFTSRAMLRHFEHEERILAALNHPNIARLYGTGATHDGLPYFVMEYVEGEPLDEFVNKRQFSLEERLRLFLKVCGAVSYAHQHLVIHRDLKPANIRVTSEGEPKLLDFGIAKLLDETAALPEQTVTLGALMTPDYASPEQVRGDLVSTASDVYSLGVVLYELLTGSKPFRLTSRRPEEIARAITDQEPARPSTALQKSKIGSESRGRDPKLLRGDLDNVVLMALRKEPERRYRTVGQLAEDIRRYLENLPVAARKDTLVYRSSKFVRRHRLAVSAAVLVLLSIVAGLVVALWQAEQARSQRDLAQRERATAEQINRFLRMMLSFSNQSVTSISPVTQKKEVTVNEMLDQITPRIDAELADQPRVRAELLRTIGSAYASNGRWDSAEKNLRAALQVTGAESPESAATMMELGVLCYRRWKLEESNQLLEKAVTFYRKQRSDRSPDYRPANLGLALDYLGVVKAYLGDTKEAAAELKEAYEILSTANLREDERGLLTFNKSDLGGILLYFGDAAKGAALLHEAEAEYRQMPGPPRWELASTLIMLSVVATNQNQLDQADGYLAESERILRETLGDRNVYLTNVFDRQAVVLSMRNKPEAAEAKLREAVAVIESLGFEDKTVWASSMWRLGDTLNRAGRAREAEDCWRQALSGYEQHQERNFSEIAFLRTELSRLLLKQDRPAEAEPIALAAREMARQHFDDANAITKSATQNLIAIYEKLGKQNEAAALKSQ